MKSHLYIEALKSKLQLCLSYVIIYNIKVKFCGEIVAINIETSEVLLFKSKSEAARKLGADVSSISRVVKGKQNKTHGYWFCNADENAVDKARAKFGDDIAKKVKELMRGMI